MISEDIYVCRRLRDAGFPVYLDTSFTCNHVGGKKYKGNFKNWFDKVAPTKGSGIAYLKQYSI
jgi:GT2 family glycosyltransferase